MKSKITHVHFPVFSDYFVHIEVASDIKKAMQKYPPTKVIEMDDSTDAVTVHVEEAMAFIFLPKNAKAGTIAHECWHAIHHMMSVFNVDIESETVAYHLGYLVEKASKLVRGRTR